MARRQPKFQQNFETDTERGPSLKKAKNQSLSPASQAIPEYPSKTAQE
jgi:hypothetical protein